MAVHRSHRPDLACLQVGNGRQRQHVVRSSCPTRPRWQPRAPARGPARSGIIAAPAAAELGRALSARFARLARGIEIGPARPEDFDGDGDERYGNRVFLRHYCAQVCGPPRPDLPAFPADARAARGFNGDIAVHTQRWRDELVAGADPAPLANRVARKTLLAVASLVSMHDAAWTTDRATAAARWSEVDPGMAGGLTVLLRWSESSPAPVPNREWVQKVLNGPVERVVETFAATVGLRRAS